MPNYIMLHPFTLNRVLSLLATEPSYIPAVKFLYRDIVSPTVDDLRLSKYTVDAIRHYKFSITPDGGVEVYLKG